MEDDLEDAFIEWFQEEGWSVEYAIIMRLAFEAGWYAANRNRE